jgi:hypothetical protein
VVPSGSAVKYGRKYIPSYSLFIPLQNVTAEMGATGICPGTHMCSETDFCAKTGFQTSGVNNNWPLGYGALINQQTTHRGSAHRDPNGPHRVVFILTFAPRPLTFTPYHVETRLIGSGGSYSLHWSQWGHTVSDYQQPLERMKQPFRTLRSMSIYNLQGDSHWGWDYITVSSGRIANEDTGFLTGDLNNFLSQGGFPWLPKYVQGNSTITDDDTSYGWVEFLQETVAKCKIAISQLYAGVVAVYVGLMLLFASVCSRMQGNGSTHLQRSVIRLVLIHAIVLSTAWVVRQRVIESSWGRNIIAQRSFQLSNSSLAMAVSLPATLPEDRDIMIFEGMQSQSFHSYARVLEVSHPGNSMWNDLVSHFAPGYSQLSMTLQEQVRRKMLQIIEMDSRRILLQTGESAWASASPEMRDVFCHKCLLRKCSPIMDSAIQSFDNDMSDIRYGYWRDTSLHKNHVSRLTLSLRNEIMSLHHSARNHTSKGRWNYQKGDAIFGNHRFTSLFVMRNTYVKPPSKNKIALLDSRIRRRNILPNDRTKDPLPTTWLNVGDAAEALFIDDVDGKHLRDAKCIT